MIRLRNRKRRAFSCQLENQPDESKAVWRTNHESTGKVSAKEASYDTYKSIMIPALGISDLLPESILENASIQGAIKSKWLLVVK